MSKITINALGLEIPAGEGGAIGKYFKNALKLRPAAEDGQRLAAAMNKPLSAMKSTEARFGFTVEEDVDVGNEDTEWSIEAESSAGLRVWTEAGETVLSGEDFGARGELKVTQRRVYAAVNFVGSVGTGIEHALGDLTFGLEPEAQIVASNYRAFTPATKLGDALAETMADFVLPGDLADIEKLPEGAVSRIEGTGSIKFSVEGKFSTSATPLSLDIPKVDKSIDIKTGVAVGIGASAVFRGAYEFRVHRRSAGEVMLGYFRKHETEFELTASVSAGAGISAGGTDVTKKLLEAVSGEPKVDREFLLRAGLNNEKIKVVEEVVEEGVNRSLEASLKLSWGRLRSDEAAFLFTIDLTKLDAAGKRVIHKALDGDLLELTSGDPPVGVEVTRSVARETVERSNTIRLNLFGAFNYSSVFELIQKGEVVHDAEMGDICFLDESTAKRNQVWINNTRAVATEKLSKLAMEAMIVSHAYSALRKDRSMEIAHFYFKYERRTGARALKDYFDVATALGLLKKQSVAALLSKQSSGRSALKAETKYKGKDSRALFLNGKKARAVDEYLAAGRKALGALEGNDEVDAFRAVLADDDKVFAAVRDAGSSGAVKSRLKELTNIPEQVHEVIHSDYLAIAWWADSMNDLGRILEKVIAYETGKAADALEADNEYWKLRKQLRKRSTKASKNTKALFGEPWGMVAMAMAATPTSAEVQITTEAAAYLYKL